jgi:hypothetical protein
MYFFDNVELCTDIEFLQTVSLTVLMNIHFSSFIFDLCNNFFCTECPIPLVSDCK